LELATELSKEYGDADQVPLVNPQDFRIKLARMSVAYAILDRNFTEDLSGLIVTAQHVRDVARLVNTIYSETACSLRYKSKQARSKNHLDDFDTIKKGFDAAIQQAKLSNNPLYREGNYFLRFIILLQSMGTARKRDLAEQMNVNPNWVAKRLAILQAYNLLETVRYGYKVTRKFNLFMRQWTSDADVQAMLDEAHNHMGKQAMEGDDAHEIYGSGSGGRGYARAPVSSEEAASEPEMHDINYDQDPFV